MKKIEIIGNWIIVIVISITTIYSFDYYKSNYTADADKNRIYIFSAKDIIENKKLNIKRAILNNTDVQKEENNLIQTIQTIDIALKEISIKLNKPIFSKESVLSGDTKDITPLIKAKLKEKGLLE
jgi:alpha-galactosidase